ncbi:molybdenum cofactor biosynthesis protein MoaB [Candidatus Bipolaricaulota bacterium]|nr:molybdenum cofactor biosynthesis protein MoaB [Candidatus Bipolaricaulota bacterium]MBS3791442.1 molybdenum cofactor biosynthesis protein MoaB [Candidatus Bipolaricaulota bacterium]
MVESEVNFHAVTVSSSRDSDSDRSGSLIRELLEADGHKVLSSKVVPDSLGEIEEEIKNAVSSDSRVLVMTGGTGLSSRDQTVDVLQRLEDKELPGFGELFRSLSYDDIGPRAALSRARASLIDDTLVFSLPGSPAAVRLGMEKLILPSIGHAVYEIDKEGTR